jgi:hypothetical protein
MKPSQLNLDGEMWDSPTINQLAVFRLHRTPFVVTHIITARRLIILTLSSLNIMPIK